MGKGNDNEITEIFRSRPAVIIEYSILLIITFFSIFFIADRSMSSELLKESDLPLYIEGEYSTDGGVTFTPYDSYDDIDMKMLNNLVIKGRLSQDVKAGHKIYLFLNYIDAVIYINDRIVYVSDPDIAYCWDALDSYAFGPYDEITIELSTQRPVLYNVSFKQFLTRLTDSTKAAVLTKMIKKDSLRLLGIGFLLVMSIWMFQSYHEYKKSEGYSLEGILACGLGILTGGMACFFNPDFITMLVPNHVLLEYVDTLAQLFAYIMVMAYLRRYIRDSWCKKWGGLLLVAGYNIIIVYMLWRCFALNASYKAIIPVMIFGVVTAGAYIYLLMYDYSISKDNRHKNVGISSAILFAMFVSEIVYYLITGVYIIDMLEIGFIVFAVSQYILLDKENIENRREAARARELENELIQGQISIMMSQIQPHFLYNALSTIRALINRNPEQARTAIDFFTKYIRSNMDSLSQKKCIPFRRELDHVESYLYIEQLRFGDMLKIVYDIETTDFEIPAMTVQTLAENAVKHGLLARKDGGTLTIRTRYNGEKYVVEIEDDGVGFNESDLLDDSRSHVGIENSRMRLAAMCDGTLEIDSRVGEGTKVTITIPEKITEEERYEYY